MSSAVFLWSQKYPKLYVRCSPRARGLSRSNNPPPVAKSDTPHNWGLTRASIFATMLASTKEIDMELTILTLVAITFAAGVVGGLVIAERFDLVEEPHERRRRERRARRQARREKNRKNVNFTIDKF